jgi:hypothetical protein
MITHNLETTHRSKLWRAYVDIDYGRNQAANITPGFQAFVKRQTGADVVFQVDAANINLEFKDKAIYTWFVLKWL